MPAHSERAGMIIPELEEAYALGKMLDHSGWNGLLRDHITPSDIDIVFDNKGRAILGDVTSSYTSWDDVLAGQRNTYRGYINRPPNCAVLCKHSITPKTGRPINTLLDIEQFQVMLWDAGWVLSQVFMGQKRWQDFVVTWVNEDDGPARIRRHVLKHKLVVLKPTEAEAAGYQNGYVGNSREGHFIHYCQCGKWASNSEGTALLKDQPGSWWCDECYKEKNNASQETRTSNDQVGAASSPA